MYKRIAFLILIALCCVAYAGDLAGIHSDLAPAKQAFSPDSRPLDRVATANDISEIAIERGGGGGKSQVPLYQCVLKSDGTVRFTKEPGRASAMERTGRIKPVVYNRLAYFINQMNLEKYADTYGEEGVYDEPVVYLSAVRSGLRKTIMDSGGCAPAQVWAIAELIDHIRLTAVQWDAPQRPGS
jgi:hypothetical protein